MALTKISPEAQETIDKIVQKSPEWWKGGICAFKIVSKETGEVLRYASHGACHAGIGVGAGPCVVINAHKPKYCGSNKDFALWVARESPFAHGVINRKNEDEIINHAGVIDREAVGSAGALWLGKAWRHFVEDTWVPGVWSQLREQGLTGLQAFIGASILDGEGNPAYMAGHVRLFVYSEPEKLRAFYDEMMTPKLKLPGSEARRPKGWALYRGNWGALKNKVKKIPDGWGGFTEKVIPVGAGNYAAKLKEIFEGDPKNVKA